MSTKTDPPDLESLRELATSITSAAQMPGLIIAAARGAAPASLLAFGSDAQGRALSEGTLFPVASITKLATALAVLRLVDEGTLGLDEPLAWHLPDALAATESRINLRGLLAHTSGLPLDIPSGAASYAPGLDWPRLRAACLETELEAPPDTRVQYSNVGYGLLATIVERHTRQPFAAALRALVLEPLGVEGYLGEEPPASPAVLAHVRGQHPAELEPFNSGFWRSLALPWAGLVTNAEGALALVRAFAELPASFLRPSTRAEATRNQAGNLAGGFVAPLRWEPCPWGLGPDLRGHKAPHWAGPASARSFGHSGASGALAWHDPDAELAWVILGSRPADSGWLLRRGPDICAALLGLGKR
jgi:beta-lactamase class C